MRELSGQLAELSGQLNMPLEQQARSLDDVVAEAEEAEERNDLRHRRDLYATAMRADSSDPVLPFNLGNVFDAQGRAAEAKIAWQIAVARDPAFAEAWYNLAMAAEDERPRRPRHRRISPRRCRRSRTMPTRISISALLLTKLDRCDEALPVLGALPGAGAAVHAGVDRQARRARCAA